VTLKIEDGKTLLTVYGEPIDITAILPADSEELPGRCINALVHEDGCIVMLHRDSYRSYDLFFLERATGAVKWKSTVWAAGNLMTVLSGRHNHCVSAVAHDGHVILFGAGDWYAYVEAFQIADGKNVFRFSTSW